MTKLTYINDEQLINDAAQMLIEKHLAWSGSDEGMPSTDLGRVGNMIVDVYLKANYPIKEWLNSSEEEKDLAEENANAIYRQAKQLADKKWEAAMRLLGME